MGASADADDGAVQVTQAVRGDVDGDLCAEAACMAFVRADQRPVFATDPAIRSVSSGAQLWFVPNDCGLRGYGVYIALFRQRICRLLRQRKRR